MSINIKCIDGIIAPSNYCCCALESVYPEPILEERQIEYQKEEVTYLIKHCEIFFKREEDSFFWKKITILQAVISDSILAISFLPIKNVEHQCLYLQKDEFGENRIGFFAPYLYKKQDKERWQALLSTPNYHTIRNLQEIDISLIKIKDPATKLELQKILICFLSDRQTLCLTVTFLKKNKPISLNWIKS